MNARAADLWERAKKALAVAKAVSSLDPDSAASRAYCAAFYAVSGSVRIEREGLSKQTRCGRILSGDGGQNNRRLEQPRIASLRCRWALKLSAGNAMRRGKNHDQTVR